MSSEPISTSTFTTDMTTNSTWDNAISHVPFPTPIAMPETDNIIAELSMYTSAMSTPLPCETSNNPDSHHGLFRTASNKRPLSAPVPTLQWNNNKKTKLNGKHENFITTEPLTPTTQSKHVNKVSKIVVNAPLSPTCQSVCTEEADEVLSMPPTPIPADTNRLPQFSKEQTRKRRALRRIALKKSRCRKDDGSVVIKSEPATKSENESATSGEPIDKKAARAIRNREAAMKSRVEAKEKMKKLQDENETLSVRVKNLTEENKLLTAQLKNLLQHTLGVKMNEETDVKNILNMFGHVNGSNVATTTATTTAKATN